MSNPYKRQSRVKPLSAYIKESLKFYELDQPIVAQISFVLLLGVTFGGFIFMAPYMQKLWAAYDKLSAKFMEQMKSMDFNAAFIDPELYIEMINYLFAVLIIVFAIKAISFVVSLFYGSWYYLSIAEPELNAGKRIRLFLLRLPKILVFNLIFYLVIATIGMFGLFGFGIVSALVPLLSFLLSLLPVALIVLNSLFVFKDLIILEFNIGIFRNFKKTLELTRAGRKNIILNSLFPLLISWIFSYFLVSIQNTMLAVLISSFIEVILLLVSQRLTVRMFIDASSPEPKN